MSTFSRAALITRGHLTSSQMVCWALAEWLSASEVAAVLLLSTVFWKAFSSPVGVAQRRARIRHLPWRLAVRTGIEEHLDLSACLSVELPPNGSGDRLAEGLLAALPSSVAFCWEAPCNLEALREDDVEEVLGEGKEGEEGALRSSSFSLRTRKASGEAAEGNRLRMRLRWFPEGNALCGRESGGCSLYLLRADEPMSQSPSDFSATFELKVGRLRHVLCHDFEASPQWGVADFGDLKEALSSDRVRLSVTLLEAPARFRITRTGATVTWALESWSRKRSFGPAAYASPDLDMNIPGIRLLVGLGPDDSDVLVSPGPRAASKDVAHLPLALFLGAPPGSALRFALEAGGRSSVFFHRFSFTEGFAGARNFLATAQEAEVDGEDCIEVRLTILGCVAVGGEEKAEHLASV